MKISIPVLSLVVLALVFLAGPAMAMKVKADMGESWIRWTWDNSTTVSVYLDGDFVGDSSSAYYYLSNAMPNSEHRLELMNASPGSSGELLSVSTVRTTPPVSMLLLLLGICFTVFIGVLVMAATGPGLELPIILTDLFGVVIAGYGRSLAYNYYGLGWVFLLFTVALAGYTIWIVMGIVREKLRW